ncbi:hypothetical protein [Sphingomonas sp.]|uniref:hypothetical protein n=1 Tax=Sphingomonas sp. TaxID=28214 RepID=UPI003D6D266A
MMVLVAGPYRSGTDDDPARMAANLERLESVTLALFDAGHLPVIGEWIALPLMRRAGSLAVGDEIYRRYAYPVAHRLLEQCQAVVRLAGASKGADEDVRRAGELGIPVYTDVRELLG